MHLISYLIKWQNDSLSVCQKQLQKHYFLFKRKEYGHRGLDNLDSNTKSVSCVLVKSGTKQTRKIF